MLNTLRCKNNGNKNRSIYLYVQRGGSTFVNRSTDAQRHISAEETDGGEDEERRRKAGQLRNIGIRWFTDRQQNSTGNRMRHEENCVVVRLSFVY